MDNGRRWGGGLDAEERRRRECMTPTLPREREGANGRREQGEFTGEEEGAGEGSSQSNNEEARKRRRTLDLEGAGQGARLLANECKHILSFGDSDHERSAMLSVTR